MMRMQLQALIRAAAGRPLSVMFPFVAQREEFTAARAEMDKALERERILGHPLPAELEVGAMLETPSLAFAPDVSTARSISSRSAATTSSSSSSPPTARTSWCAAATTRSTSAS